MSQNNEHNSRPTDDQATEGQLVQAQLEFIEEWQSGSRPTLEQYVDKYPDIAADLIDFILTFAEVEAALERTPEVTTPSPAAEQARDRALAGPCGSPVSLMEVRKNRGITLGKMARDLNVPVPLAMWFEHGNLIDWPERLEDELGGMFSLPGSYIRSCLQTAPPEQAAAHHHAEGIPSEQPAQKRSWDEALNECQRLKQLTDQQAAKWQLGEEN